MKPNGYAYGVFFSLERKEPKVQGGKRILLNYFYAGGGKKKMYRRLCFQSQKL
jgi:hypothetical protein